MCEVRLQSSRRSERNGSKKKRRTRQLGRRKRTAIAKMPHQPFRMAALTPKPPPTARSLPPAMLAAGRMLRFPRSDLRRPNTLPPLAVFSSP